VVKGLPAHNNHHHHATTTTTWDTVTAFAAALGVSRRRIAKWREAGAPTGLDAGLWRSWLLRVGKRRYVQVLDNLRPDLVGGVPSGSQVPETPAAPPLPALPADATSGDLERHWKARRAQLQVELLEKELAEAERRLVPIERVRTAFAACVAGLLQAQADHVWLALLPELDGVDPALRRRLRLRHDACITTLRERLQTVLRDALARVCQE
jgi:hypothetical protein